MDRVKAQASQIAQQAQEAAQEGRARFDQAQQGRRGDMLLRQLGALVFAERTGRGTGDSDARIDQLISDISALESQSGLNLADPSQQGFGQSVFGQPVPGQSAGPPPSGQGAQGQTGQQPGSPASPPPGAADTGSASPGATASPADSPGPMPPVDTTTNFFPAPDDDVPGGPPQS
jgi:hypothetical protein